MKLDSIKTSNNNTPSLLQGAQNTTAAKSIVKTDSVTLSTNSNDKSKNNKKSAYILGGIALAIVTAFAIIKYRKRNILKKGCTGNKPAPTPEKPPTTETVNKPVENPKPNNEIPLTPDKGSKPKGEPIKPDTTAPLAGEAAALSKSYDLYTQALIEEIPELASKKELIRKVVPDLMKATQEPELHKEALKVITPKNSDFIVKDALPKIIKHEEILDLRHSKGEVLEILAQNNINCIEELATNIEKFKIKGSTDTLLLLKAINPKNKEFAFNDLFPYLLENSEKYKITSGGYLAQFLEVVTPKNKDFVLNKAVPELLNNSKKLNIDIATSLEIAPHVDPNNIKNIQVIADNLDKYSVTGKLGFLDVNKFCQYLNEIK